MKKNRLNTVKGFVLCFVSMVVLQAMGDGYRNPPPTAEGIGKSGVNSAFVDDASAISYNPANLAMQTNRSLVISATFAKTDTDYSPSAIPGTTYSSDGSVFVLPNIYYSQPIGDNGLAAGFSINTPNGQGSAWNSSDLQNLITGPDPVLYEANLMMINFNPTVAFRVTDDVYAGAGLDLYYSKLELKAVGAIAPPPFPPPTYLADGEGEGIGLGANFGITWLPTDQQRVTFTYRSETEIEYEGDFSSPLPNNGNFGVTIKYPNIIGVGYGIMLSDDIEIEALFEWLEWSSNDSQTLDAGGSPVTVVNNWDDTITFGFGGSWQVNESIVARAGYAYLPTPIPDGTITPLLPDADRHAISFGLGYTAGAHTVDLAYTVSIYDDRSAPITGAGPGTYEIDSNLIGLTYSLSF